MFGLFDEEKIPKRYKRQLPEVKHFVMHEIEKKDIKINKRELDEILDILFEYRVID